jgi:multidrug efflux system membrane fusion protein
VSRSDPGFVAKDGGLMRILRMALLWSALPLGSAAAAYYFELLPARFAFPKWLAKADYRAGTSSQEVPAANSRAVPVKVAPVTVEEVPIYLTGIGTVQAYNIVNVRSKVDGEIVQILFQEGQDVRQNDELVSIDPRPLQAQLDQQIAIREKDRALLNGALVDMKRYDSLAGQRDMAIARQVVDQQHALVEQYKAQVSNDDAQVQYARTQLEFTSIRAPISGRVGIRQVDQGNFVRGGDSTILVVITQLKPISVIFTLSSVAVGQTRITPGRARAPVAAIGPDNTTIIDRGVVDVVDNQVDPSTGTIKIKATFPNLGLKLWPGNFVNGRITVDTRSGTTVPSVAIRHGPQGDFVWVVKSDMTVAARNIVVAQVFGDRCLVDRGLVRGERVVTEGYYRLQNGSRVEIDGPSERQSPVASPSLSEVN